MDERRIHRIEELRDGGDLRLKLEVCFTLLLHPLVARVMEDGLLRSPHRPVAGVTEDVRLEPHIHFANATFHIEVAQSDWIKAVLPGLGYDRIQLIEVPRLGAEAGDFAKSVQALKRANEYFLRGDYGASVGDCRLAIEPIRKDLDLRGRKDCSPKLLALLTDKEESDFLEGIGTATGDWLTKLINATYRRTSDPHHNLISFSRQSAAEIMLVTTAIVSLVSRLPYGDAHDAEESSS